MARKSKPVASSSVVDERTALFNAVKDTPDEDAPRLALADWLEKDGDESDHTHAALIRTQCEILRLWANVIDPQQPETIHSLLRATGYHNNVLPFDFEALIKDDKRITSLRAREKTLLKQMGENRLASAANLHQAVHWHRGFGLFRLPSNEFPTREVKAFADCPNGPRMETLDLRLTSSTSSRIARNPLLAHASGFELNSLSSNPDGLATVLASPYLSRLRRIGTSFGGKETLAAIKRAPQRNQLTHLWLHGCRFDGVRCRSLASMELPALAELHLGGNHVMGPKGAQALAKAPFLAHLRLLDLVNCRIGLAGLEAILSAQQFRCPTMLEIGSSKLGPAGLRALLAAPGLENVAVLEIDIMELDDAAIADLASSPRLARLLRLDLSQNRAMGPASAEALANSPHLARLASLDLQLCPIGEAGARALLKSPHLRRLQLVIDQDGVSKDTIAALSKRYCLEKF